MREKTRLLLSIVISDNLQSSRFDIIPRTSIATFFERQKVFAAVLTAETNGKTVLTGDDRNVSDGMTFDLCQMTDRQGL